MRSELLQRMTSPTLTECSLIMPYPAATSAGSILSVSCLKRTPTEAQHRHCTLRMSQPQSSSNKSHAGASQMLSS